MSIAANISAGLTLVDKSDLVIPFVYDNQTVSIIATGTAGAVMIIIWWDGNVTEHEFTGGEDTISNEYTGKDEATVVITGNRAAVTEINLGDLDTSKTIDLGVWFPNTTPAIPADAILTEDDQPIITEDDLYITLEAA